ncbi:MAG: hypothetical protein GY702_06085 [Desulfobulbaceae bacterium]|nr:hypothetical protein [Desulfobulbaceae bacterium]
MNEPGALDERLRTLVMQSFEGGGERLPKMFMNYYREILIACSKLLT